jgi:hypothetical protein
MLVSPFFVDEIQDVALRELELLRGEHELLGLAIEPA